MEFFRIKRDIPFMRNALVFNIISALTFFAAVFFLATRGLHFSLEFTGGTVSEIHYAQAADLAHVRESVDKLGFGEVQVQNFGTSQDVMIRVPVRADVKQAEVAQQVFDALCAADKGEVGKKTITTPKGELVTRPSCPQPRGSEPFELSRTEFVGPSGGAELAQDGAKALAFVVIGIMI